MWTTCVTLDELVFNHVDIHYYWWHHTPDGVWRQTKTQVLSVGVPALRLTLLCGLQDFT